MKLNQMNKLNSESQTKGKARRSIFVFQPAARCIFAGRDLSVHRALLAIAFIGGLLYSGQARAQDTNTLEVIKQLQQRIDELEHKVNKLEQEKGTTEQVVKTN